MLRGSKHSLHGSLITPPESMSRELPNAAVVSWDGAVAGLQVRLMCQFWNTLEVTILAPYIPSAQEQQDAALYAVNVRHLYSQTLSLPLVEQVTPARESFTGCTQAVQGALAPLQHASSIQDGVSSKALVPCCEQELHPCAEGTHMRVMFHGLLTCCLHVHEHP